MSITDVQARDEINALVLAAWEANATDIVGSAGHELRWQGKEERGSPNGFFARVSVQIISQPLASFADENTFGSNARRYETNAVVFIQLFAPKSARNAFRVGLTLCEMLRDAFRSAGQDGEVWYANARCNPLVDDGSNYRWNVVSEARYDTIQ